MLKMLNHLYRTRGFDSSSAEKSATSPQVGASKRSLKMVTRDLAGGVLLGLTQIFGAEALFEPGMILRESLRRRHGVRKRVDSSLLLFDCFLFDHCLFCHFLCYTFFGHHQTLLVYDAVSL